MKRYLGVLAVCILLLAHMTSMTFGAAREITFWVMPNAPSDTHTAWLDAKVEEFRKETGITVRYEIVGWGDAWNRLATAVTSGEGADVMQVGTTWNPQLAAMGGLAKINISEFGGEAAFMPANYKSTIYKKTCYGVPWFAETRCLFYNRDHFAQAGVQPPKTYDELVTVGQALVRARGAGTAIAIAGNQAWDLLHNWAIVLWAFGGDLLSPDLKTATFAGPEGVRAMNWYVDLVRTGLASKACAEYTQPDADAAFINGNVSMAFLGPWNIANIEHDNPTLNYDVVEPPAGPKGRAAFSGGSNLAILANSKKQADAIAWVKFLIRKDNLVPYTKDLTHFVPSTVAAFADPYFSQGVYKTFKAALEYATPYPQLGVWGTIENAITGEFKEILTDYVEGKLGPDGIQRHLNTAAERVNAALKMER
ncbi:MAG: extracellular solute-binding protein [Firmicutes bacterium]|jgi:multiple sugar transport system substrate-binding protein|nr:extracellular solute-binding protein [Bacillota bacterium]